MTPDDPLRNNSNVKQKRKSSRQQRENFALIKCFKGTHEFAVLKTLSLFYPTPRANKAIADRGKNYSHTDKLSREKCRKVLDRFIENEVAEIVVTEGPRYKLTAKYSHLCDFFSLEKIAGNAEKKVTNK